MVCSLINTNMLIIFLLLRVDPGVVFCSTPKALKMDVKPRGFMLVFMIVSLGVGIHMRTGSC